MVTVHVGLLIARFVLVNKNDVKKVHVTPF